jgi:PAS domain S-box-containing protein
MKNPSDNWEELRRKVLGLGDSSLRKTHYPSLRQRLAELERLRSKLQQSEAELRRLIDAIPQHVVVLDPDGSFLYLNQVALEYSGLTLEDSLAKDAMAKIFHPDDLERVVGERRQAISRGVQWDAEVRIRGKDGNYRWFIIRLNPLRDEQGRILRWYGTSTDIEDRKRAEETLRGQVDLLNLTHDAIFVADMEGVIKYWNHGTEERYGWTAEQAVGTVVHDLLKTVFPAPLEQIKAELTRTGRWEGELVHARKDGSQVVVASRWSLQRGERGAPVAILETNNDITERKRAEEALRRLNRELRAISNCNQSLLRATDEQSLLGEICRIVCEEAGYRMAWVAYAEHDAAKSVRPAAWTGTEEGYLANLGITWADTERGWSPTGTAIRSGKTCCIQDFATDPRLAPWRQSALQRGFLSGIALPLKDEHASAFGSLSIYSAQPNAFTSEEIRLLEELAADLAFGLVTLRSRAARKRAEEALRRSEAYLAESQRLTRTGSWAFDLASNEYIYASEEVFRIFEMDAQEGLPNREPISRQIYVEDWDRVNESFEKSLREKVDTSSEFRIVLPSGTVKHLQAIRHPVMNDAGDLVKLVGTVIDITEHKRAEEALRQSEAYLAETQGLSHTGSWALDVADDRYAYCSEECLRIYGFDPQEGLPTREAVFRRVLPEDLDRVTREFEKSLREKVDSSGELRIVLPDGTVKDIHVIRHPVLNSVGDVVKLVGTSIDITERKRAEAALRESETRFRTFVDHAADAFFVLDMEQGTIIDANRRACESLGYTRQELMGMTPMAFDVNLDQTTLESVAERTAAGETELFDRHWHRRKDGSLFPVEVQTSVIWYGGRRFLLKVARDISDRLRAEEHRERLHQLEADLAHINRVSMLGELAASIAHEVNQPLSGVVVNGNACLRWLAGDAPNLEEAREAVRRIVRDGKRAGDVIARIRALATKTAAAKERLDMNEAIREVVAFAQDEVRRNNVILRVELADALSPVLGDRVQLQQVVLNLVTNGIEAMSSVEERPRELIVRTQNDDAGQVRVTVQDSGKGLDPQSMERIFDAFYTTKHGGMGMGLSISRSIIQNHGGKLWAVANEGPGISVQFTIPRYQ